MSGAGVVADKDYDPYMFVYMLSAVFGAVFVIGPLLVPPGPDRALIRISIMQAAFYMWIAWVTVYCSQINPINGLRFKRTMLGFISYSWGNTKGIKPFELPTTTTIRNTRFTRVSTTKRTIRATTSAATEAKTMAAVVDTMIIRYGNETRIINVGHNFLRSKYFYERHEVVYDPMNPYKGRLVFQLKAEKYGVVTLHHRVPTVRFQFGNTKSSIEVLRNGIWVERVSKRTPGIVTDDKFSRFWISWNGGKMAMGKEKDYHLLSCQMDPFWVKYVSLYGVGDWIFEEGIVDKSRDTPTSMKPTVMKEIYEANKAGKQSKEFETTSRQVTVMSSLATLEEEKTSKEIGNTKDVFWQTVPTPAYILASGHYTFFPASEEPIQFEVLLDEGTYKEFFVLLSTTATTSEPSIVIHIGALGGRTCTITRNGKIVFTVNCRLEWQADTYLHFWIWYRYGHITVISGYSSPDFYGPFISWSDPEPFAVQFYGLRTPISQEMFVYVYDRAVEKQTSNV